MRLALQQLVAIGRAGRTDAGGHKGHIKDIARAEFAQTVKGKRALKLENSDGRAEHIVPHLVVLPVDLMRLRIRFSNHRIGILDDFDVLQSEDVVLHQTGLMHAFHVDLKDLLAIGEKRAVVVAEGDRAALRVTVGKDGQ